MNDKIISKKEIDKDIDLDDIMDIINNCPGINIKTIRKIININYNNFCIEKNIITYMINIGLLYAQDYDDNTMEINDDTKLFAISEINLFM